MHKTECLKLQKLRIYWQKMGICKTIQFHGIPFSVVERKLLDCQFRTNYLKQKSVQGKCLWLQGMQKFGCKAHVAVKAFSLCPGCVISEGEREGLSKWKLRCLQEEKMTIKKETEMKRSVKIAMKYFMSLPQEACSGHPTGQVGLYTKMLNPAISQQILVMGEAGVTPKTEIKHSLKFCVADHHSKELDTGHKQGTDCFIHFLKTYVIMSTRPKEHWTCLSMIKRTYISKLKS